MFYPESALVKRTPGIATVWLMATLGARQNLKRVTKQAILKVDIPHACDAVCNPQAPMALRLQSNLLYGISRVYSQKCVYILTDAEATQVALKNLFRHVQISELDPRAGKARPETLVVPDDPTFIPDLHFHIIDFDVSTFDSSGVSLQSSGGVSVPSQASSRSNGSLHNSEPLQFDIPASGSFSGGVDFHQPASNHGAYQPPVSSVAEDTALHDDLGFEFDDTGHIIDHEMLDVVPQVQDVHQQIYGQYGIGLPAESDIAITDAPGITDTDGDVPMDQDGQYDNGFLPVDDIDMQVQESIEQSGFNTEEPTTEQSDTSEYVQAPQAHRKKKPVIPRDAVLQVPNTELLQWRTDYTQNMQNARKLKWSRQQSRYAKQNAIFVLTGNTFGVADTLSNLSKLVREQFTGSPIRAQNDNHEDQDSDVDSADTEELDTRGRVREEEDVEATRDDIGNGDDFTALNDDHERSIELAREAMAAMEDHSTQLPLPWSGSRAGSMHSARASRQASVLSNRVSVNQAATRAGSVHSFDRRTSRLPSASPMPGRGTLPRSSAEVQRSQDEMDDAGFLPGFDSGPDTSPARCGADNQEFEMFGPAAGVSTQEADESQWLRDALNRESKEFLAWIQNSLNAKKDDEDLDAYDYVDTVRFDELLPVDKHSRIVAAQGFLHTLVLANKGVIRVTQEVQHENGDDWWWAPLHIGLVDNVAEDVPEA